jgi:DNA polymerase-3 subunit delta'
VRVLEKSLDKGRLAHAILLHSEELEVLDSVALALAGALLDTPRPAEHPDLLTLRPSGKARFIKIGERSDPDENTMRHFLHAIHQTPNRGERKVGIVHECDRMNAATANAFLKTLEEPPRSTTLLLLTSRPYDLLDTIRSRCFNFRLPQIRGAYEDPRWTQWLDSYREWIDAARAGPRQPREVANAVMGLYGLVARFSNVLGQLSDAAWEREKAKLPPNLPDDQLAAHETGVRKGTRARLLGGIDTPPCTPPAPNSRRTLSTNSPAPCATSSTPPS